MPLKIGQPETSTFFGDPALDDDLPFVNRTFWVSLIEHVERDCGSPPRVILDVGCHTGGLLLELSRRFSPSGLYGIEPLEGARELAMQRLSGAAARVTVLKSWDEIPLGAVDLITSHEVLYLVPDLSGFMRRVRKALAPHGAAYVVLGCHSENPLWGTWREQLIAVGRQVYDHAPLEIMEAASSSGLLPSVQPLRTSGWVTYDPLRAAFQYADIRTMLDHHYRFKLIFRLCIAGDA